MKQSVCDGASIWNSLQENIHNILINQSHVLKEKSLYLDLNNMILVNICLVCICMFLFYSLHAHRKK